MRTLIVIVLILVIATPVYAVQDVTDVVDIMRHVLGHGGVARDLNGDGIVDIKDVVLAMQIVLNRGHTMKLTQQLDIYAPDGATDITVRMPLYYSDSRYVINDKINSTHYGDYDTGYIIYTIPEIAAGNSEQIRIDYAISFNAIDITWSTPELEVARQIYDKHKGSGNCRDLAQAFVADCEKAGLTAREVVGFVPVGDGCLSGRRHSWAEVSISGQWIPVDLTHKTFGVMTNTHIIEGYSDRQITITSSGTVIAEWGNHWRQ